MVLILLIPIVCEAIAVIYFVDNRSRFKLIPTLLIGLIGVASMVYGFTVLITEEFPDTRYHVYVGQERIYFDDYKAEGQSIIITEGYSRDIAFLRFEKVQAIILVPEDQDFQYEYVGNPGIKVESQELLDIRKVK